MRLVALLAVVILIGGGGFALRLYGKSARP